MFIFRTTSGRVCAGVTHARASGVFFSPRGHTGSVPWPITTTTRNRRKICDFRKTIPYRRPRTVPDVLFRSVRMLTGTGSPGSTATMEDSILKLCIVGILWGSTNPFLKAATNKLKLKRNKKLNIISEVIDHLSNWNYLVPFLINQCGSLLFYFTLKYSEISLAVPIANGVSFLSMSFVGTFIGEEKPTFRTMTGLLFLLFGIICLIVDKQT